LDKIHLFSEKELANCFPVFGQAADAYH